MSKKFFFLFLYTPVLLFLGVSVDAQSSILQALQSDTREIAEKVIPSVVTIDVSSSIEVANTRDFFFFFSPFGEENEEEDAPKRKYDQRSLGSGIIVQKKGEDLYYVLTNEHVISNADEVFVTTHTNEQFEAEIVGVDTGRDLAIISFETKSPYQVAMLGDSDKLNPGDIVFAVGNPYGFQFTITFGIVSALNRNSRVVRNKGTLTDYIQTDAAVNRGNSGGPLVNIKGEVVGINTWIYSEGGGGNEGLSFAIPINNAMRSIDSVIKKGSVDDGWLGVSIDTVRGDQMESLGRQKGAIVIGVYSGSPAERAGVKAGDIIYGVDGTEINTFGDLMKTIAGIPPQKRVVVDIYRNTIPLSLSIQLGRRVDDAGKNAELWPGFMVSDITKSVRKRVTLEGVIITSVNRGSSAYTAGLKAGDIIVKVNNTKIKNLKEFYASLNLIKKKGEVLFRLQRDSTFLTIGLEYK